MESNTPYLTIDNLYANLGEETKSILRPRFDNILSRVLISLNEVPRSQLTPPISKIMRAFELCPLNKVKVVICGQDVYHTPGAANGLSFSSNNGVQPSLRNIYKCLVNQKLIDKEPTHGDLSSWAEQGVLLINSALTTLIGKANAHASIWVDYTDAIIEYLGDVDRDPIVFILLGLFAQKKAKLISGQHHHILMWGHPSPLASQNRTNNADAFINCNVFSMANSCLPTPINWNSISSVVAPSPVKKTKTKAKPTIIGEKLPISFEPGSKNVMWIFTDGSANNNGSQSASATWGIYMTNSDYHQSLSGKVTGKQSNNTGELAAIIEAGKECLRQIENPSAKLSSLSAVAIVSDSEYAINSIMGTYNGKLNPDLITEGRSVFGKLASLKTTYFHHVRGHGKDAKLHSFYVNGNRKADALCAEAQKK